MIGALTSGRLADTLGRKTVNYFDDLDDYQRLVKSRQSSQYLRHLHFLQTMRLAAIVGIFGWLTIYFAKVCSSLNYFLFQIRSGFRELEILPSMT
jgi:hypothetical protein